MIGREMNSRESLPSGTPHSALLTQLFYHYFPLEILYTPMTVVCIYYRHKPVTYLIRLLGGGGGGVINFFTADLNYRHKSIVISMLCVTDACNI